MTLRDQTITINQLDSDSQLEFIGYVSDGEEHKKFFNQKPNIITEQKILIENYYLPEMARASALMNKDQVKVAVVDCCVLGTNLDETDPYHYDREEYAGIGESFPSPKTFAGALQCSTMPWECTSRQNYWGLAGGLSMALALFARVH